jgi:hypothetical protein
VLSPRRAPPLLALGLVAGLMGCASTRPLTPLEARELSERRYDADGDEVYDATWLLLEKQGFQVVAHDRQAGIFTARHADGRGYDVEVAALGSTQLVRAVPTGTVTHSAQLDAWDHLEHETLRLLRTWQVVPEWRFDARRSSLEVPGFSAAIPRDWGHLDFSVNRRRVTVQVRKVRGPDFNPTLLVEVDRRRYWDPTLELGQAAMGLALTATKRLVFPDEIQAKEDGLGAHAALRVLDGNLSHDVTMHLWSAADETWSYRLALACPAEKNAAACEAAWAGVVRSLVAPGARRQPLE